MRKTLLAAVAFLSGSVAATAQLQPLNVSTGLWQITTTSTVNAAVPPEVQAQLSQLPPDQRARLEGLLNNRLGGAPATNTYTRCMTPADLRNPAFQDPTDQCMWSPVTSTGSDMELRTTSCAANARAAGSGSVKIHVIDSRNATGSVQFSGTANGQPFSMNATLAGKWLRATCEGQ